MDSIIEGIFEAFVEFVLELTVGAAQSKKVPLAVRVLASLFLLAICVALLALFAWGTVYLYREDNIVGAVVLALVALFIAVLCVAAFVSKAREIRQKSSEEAKEAEPIFEQGAEVWDLYTAEEKLADIKIKRGDKIPKGLYHLVCEILVLHKDGSYLCMKRASTKENYPNYYEATAGGSALAGEDKWQCAKRELREETGLSCNNLKELARLFDEEKQTVYHCFLGIVDCEKNSVRLREGETDSYIWLNEAEFADFLNSNKVIECQKERFKQYFTEKGYI